MAIDDIVTRIVADAGSEASSLVAAAEARAERVLDDARRTAEEQAARTLARGRADAEREAATIAANARLSARDDELVARMGLVQEALDQTRDALVALPDESYAVLLASRTADSVEGIQGVRLGAADDGRLRASLPAALQAAGIDVPIDPQLADIERGVVLVGDGVRVEISPQALVESRRDEWVASLDRALFGTGG